MKKILFASLSILVCSFINAQNPIPSPGFEAWTNHGSYDEPTGWGTINPLTAILGIKTVTKATGADVHSGTLAIKLESKTVPIQGVAPGIAATGTINQSTQSVDGGVPYDKRPTSITGWYKYQPTGTDTCSIEAMLSKWNSNTNQREDVGSAEFTQSATVGAYTQFTANFTYTSADDPDTLVVILLTSQLAQNSPNGTKLFVDDLDLVLPTAINNIPDEAINLYPNPSTDKVAIELSSSDEFSFSVYNLEGKLVEEKTISGGKSMVDVKHLPAGVYSYQLKNTNSGSVNSGKLQIER